MIRLETSSGEVLSTILKEISPIQYASNKQVNRLLDGSYHVQIIGSPLRSMDAAIVASHSQAEILNLLADQGTPLLLRFINKKYMVFIEDAVQWKRINYAFGNKDKSFFEGHIRMIIKEEVVT